MIKLVKKDCDNGLLTCKDCNWYEEADYSVRLDAGCTHPILYDDEGNIIDDVNDMIIECLENPKHCILMECKK